MKKNLNNLDYNIEDDSNDIIPYLRKIWKERKLIAKSIVTFFFIGCLIAILSPIIYTSETTFVPQISDDQMSSNNKLGNLANLAGVKLTPTELTNDSYLSPLVYTNITDSEEFSLKLLSAELINSDKDRFTIREYLISKESSFNLIGAIKKYILGLFLNTQNEKTDSDIYKNFNFISEADYYLISVFRKKFTIELNPEQGYIKVLASDEDPFISTQLVQQITKSLQAKIIEIRTNKIRERLEFSKEQYELKQAEFNFLQKKLAEFKDSNKIISTASFRSELQKLESEYQLQQNILINLATEYNNNKIKLNKDTPIFSVIDEVSVPNKKSKPKRAFLIVVFVFIGLLFSTGFAIGKDPFINLIKEIKN